MINILKAKEMDMSWMPNFEKFIASLQQVNIHTIDLLSEKDLMMYSGRLRWLLTEKGKVEVIEDTITRIEPDVLPIEFI